jgi:hypothetical protein
MLGVSQKAFVTQEEREIYSKLNITFTLFLTLNTKNPEKLIEVNGIGIRNFNQFLS